MGRADYHAFPFVFLLVFCHIKAVVLSIHQTPAIMLIVNFCLLYGALFAVIMFAYSRTQKVNDQLPRNGLFMLYSGLLLWTIYLIVLDHSGVLRQMLNPPRIPLFVILPAFVFIAWFYATGKHRPFTQSIPIWQPVLTQSFRIGVEFLILGIYLKGIGPVQATFEGYNFDIVSGLLAIPVAWLLYRKAGIARAATWTWSILSLLLLANIIFIFNTLVLRPQMWGFTQNPISAEFTQMPYLLIAGFYMPFAVFLHMFTFMQLRKIKAS